MDIRRCGPEDSDALADLRFAWASEGGPPPVSQDAFRTAFRSWFATAAATHTAFLAELDGVPVGMAWLALLDRVIDPMALQRVSGDLQSVYVLPQHRDGGVGEALVAAVLALADEAATEHVTVSSSSRAVSLYQRCGFAVSPRLLKRAAQD